MRKRLSVFTLVLSVVVGFVSALSTANHVRPAAIRWTSTGADARKMFGASYVGGVRGPHVFANVPASRLTLLHRLSQPDDVQGVELSPDGRFVAVLSRRWIGKDSVKRRVSDAVDSATFISVWDTRTFRLVWVINIPGLTDSVAFSPDNAQLALLTHITPKVTLYAEDVTHVSVRRIANGHLLRSLPHPAARGDALAFSHNGRILAVGDSQIKSRQPTVSLYSTRHWRKIRTLRGGVGVTAAISFSQDDTRLAMVTGGHEGFEEVRAWDVRTGRRWLLEGNDDNGDEESLLGLPLFFLSGHEFVIAEHRINLDRHGKRIFALFRSRDMNHHMGEAPYVSIGRYGASATDILVLEPRVGGVAVWNSRKKVAVRRWRGLPKEIQAVSSTKRRLMATYHDVSLTGAGGRGVSLWKPL